MDACADTASLTVRSAREDDLPGITEIYNHYVLSTPATFDVEAFTVEARKTWFSQFAASGPHRLLVADSGGAVAGYTTSGRFRPKRAYDATVGTTVYCAPEATGRGIGRMLYSALFEALEGEDLHLAIAGVALPNDTSVALHERFGFSLSGVMHAVGRKFGRYWDVAWYEKRLGGPEDDPDAAG